MRHLVTIIFIVTCGHFSLSEIWVQSYYFKAKSTDLTLDSQRELLNLVSRLEEGSIRIVELGSYANDVYSDSAKRLSDVRMLRIIDILKLEKERVVINSWGNERINVKFVPLSWDRIDIYCDSEEFVSPKENDIQMLSKVKSNKKEALVLNVLFEGGTSKMIKETLFNLDVLYDTLQRNPSLQAHIRGHVCCGKNMRISRKRAKAVYKHLITMGLSEKRLSYKGYSNSLPLVYPEKSDKDRRLNRRVDVVFYSEVMESQNL